MLCHVDQSQSLSTRSTGRPAKRLSDLNGQDFYLGPHGTKASHIEYDRLIAD